MRSNCRAQGEIGSGGCSSLIGARNIEDGPVRPKSCQDLKHELDFVLDVGQRLWRVQVKSSSARQYGSYLVNLQRNANGEVVPYDASEIDFVVAYVMPCDAWFVIPVEAIYGRQSAKLCRHGNPRSGRLGKYWEAWGLMTMRWTESG